MLYTIGHSNHETAVFLGLLRQHDVTGDSEQLLNSCLRGVK
jgi:hypothetical protein